MCAMRSGNMPERSQGWQKIDYLEAVEPGWFVFEQKQAHSSEWRNYKIVADGRAKDKANYWLAKNMRTGRTGFGRDMALMRENRPELCEDTESVLEIRSAEYNGKL